MNAGSEQQRTVRLSFSAALAEYLARVQQLGAVEGVDGSLTLNPTLQPVLEAMHHVLAGGEVEVHVVRGGQQDIFQELQQRTAQALQETNSLQLKSGTGADVAV